MDFIVKLPKSENSAIGTKYNSILVIVDKFTKYAYLILYNNKFTVKQITQVILDRIIRYYGILETITLDKDKIFISNFW